ncbi:MAG: hypothetical protein N2560_00295 [Ignavibacteria bacterium]|nr:hypothetical protein [Ignavibacteria bacterium]
MDLKGYEKLFKKLTKSGNHITLSKLSVSLIMNTFGEEPFKYYSILRK